MPAKKIRKNQVTKSNRLANIQANIAKLRITKKDISNAVRWAERVLG